jgi:hypothetical protein
MQYRCFDGIMEKMWDSGLQAQSRRHQEPGHCRPEIQIGHCPNRPLHERATVVLDGLNSDLRGAGVSVIQGLIYESYRETISPSMTLGKLAAELSCEIDSLCP